MKEVLQIAYLRHLQDFYLFESVKDGTITKSLLEYISFVHSNITFVLYIHFLSAIANFCLQSYYLNICNTLFFRHQ